jgi:D-serine deaminase-like pyridoxal phosphate-dependent protein
MIDWQSLLQRNEGDLRTPALVIDLDGFECNVRKMAEHCVQNGISLRPHAKTHKCAEIARRQVLAGAIGQCCANLDEAELLVRAGISSILITSPLVTEAAIRRLLELNAASAGLIAVVDNDQAVRRLSHAAFGVGQTLKLLVDIDIGHHRTGTTPGKPVCALASLISNSPNLEFLGIQGYAGHLMHVHDRAERQTRLKAGLDELRHTRDLLLKIGLSPQIITGGGTGSFDIDPAEHVLTELQAGSYVFMDRQYNDVWAAIGRPPFETSLFVLTRVVSANHPGMATTDAGLKAFATDAEAPLVCFGPKHGATYSFFGDEYGCIRLGEDVRAEIGDVVACVTPHCDPTVNLYGHYLVVRGGELIDRWPIASGKYRTL